MDYLVYAILFIFGACWGSFLNVVIARFAKGTFLRKRSFCPNCGQTLSASDLIPLLSFIFLGGRCRHCRAKISWQYPAVELVSGLLFALGVDFFIGTASAFFYIFVVSAFLVLFVYDIRHYLIPDRVSLPAIILFFLFNLYFGASLVNLLIAIFGGAAWFAWQFFVSGGRWVGGGDIRLGAMLGALLPHPWIWLALFLAYVSGSIVALILLALGKKSRKDHLPFAAFLLPAGFAVWLWGGMIWEGYLRMLGY